jgi:cell division protein FtsQ
MKGKTRNARLTSDRDRRRQFFVEGVVKRGTNATWTGICRWTWRCIKVLLVAALVAGAYWGATEGWRQLFWNNPSYALKEVSFTTDGSLTREQALQVTRLAITENIFSYKLPAVREALRNLPQVESAEVRRYLPNRIEISVVERKPVAWITARLAQDPSKSPRSHLLDARGLVFQPKHTPYEYGSLPVIGGVELEDLEPGKPIRKAEVVAALELLRRIRETGDFKVQAIDVSKGYAIVATDQKHAQLTFGLDDIDGQLQRFGSVQGEAALIGQDVQTVNLMLTRNIPVTFMTPPPPEPPEPTAPEPSHGTRAKEASGQKPGNSGSKIKAMPAARKDEPSRPKDGPRKDGDGPLKRFHAA